MSISNIDYYWLNNETKKWQEKPSNDIDIEKRLKAIYWVKNGNHRILLLNANVPIVGKNVDLCLLNGTKDNLILKGKEIKNSIHKDNSKYLSLGELKGGIDPAGADEHWKTANSALNRIKQSFAKISMKPSIFFIGAAIEQSMAEEIFKQLTNNELTNAANLHKEEQLIDLCKWLLNE